MSHRRAKNVAYDDYDDYYGDDDYYYEEEEEADSAYMVSRGANGEVMTYQDRMEAAFEEVIEALGTAFPADGVYCTLEHHNLDVVATIDALCSGNMVTDEILAVVKAQEEEEKRRKEEEKKRKKEAAAKKKKAAEEKKQKALEAKKATAKALQEKRNQEAAQKEERKTSPFIDIHAVPKYPGIPHHTLQIFQEVGEQLESRPPHLSVVCLGHVDSGKSTLIAQLLKCVGDATYSELLSQAESKTALANVMDTTEEERERGNTIRLGFGNAATPNRLITLIDAPGHRSYLPNAVRGTAIADAAIIVLDASVNGAETGLLPTGVTRDHLVLARSMGLTKLIVAVSKLDMMGWSQQRFLEIQSILRPHFRALGFPDGMVEFVPVSGAAGVNIIPLRGDWLSRARGILHGFTLDSCGAAYNPEDSRLEELILSSTPKNPEELTSWYRGRSLCEVLDSIPVAEVAFGDTPRAGTPQAGIAEALSKTHALPLPPRHEPLILCCVHGTGKSAGLFKVLQGTLFKNDNLAVSPLSSIGKVTSISWRGRESSYGAPGMMVEVSLSLEVTKGNGYDFRPGDVLTSPNRPIPPLRYIEVDVAVFGLGRALVPGSAVSVVGLAGEATATVIHILKAQGKKKRGKKSKAAPSLNKKPNVTPQGTASLRLLLDYPLSVTPRNAHRELSRVVLRQWVPETVDDSKVGTHFPPGTTHGVKDEMMTIAAGSVSSVAFVTKCKLCGKPGHLAEGCPINGHL